MLMVQSNAQLQMKTGKIKGPPPVPPRPNQNVVAEALAKTRRAVAESKVKPKVPPKELQKAKTLDRTSATGVTNNVSPKLNGLARVKSFIRDVISDRSSSDEKRSNGTNSRRSSTDSSSIPGPVSTKKQNDSTNNKSLKNCKQVLVRSLSTSNKLDDGKCKVNKSSSFAEKTMPLRKAPPPPLSPKPKLRQIKPVTLPNRNSLEKLEKTKARPEISSPIIPVQSPKSPKTPPLEAPYATVDEVEEFDDRLRDHVIVPVVESNKSTEEKPVEINTYSEIKPVINKGCEDKVDLKSSKSLVEHVTEKNTNIENLSNHSTQNNVHDEEKTLSTCVTNGSSEETNLDDSKTTNTLERKTSRVTEMLISEIIEGRKRKQDSNAVIDKGKENVVEDSSKLTNGEVLSSEGEKRLNNMNNHEMLIFELQSMRSQTQIPELSGSDSPPESPDTAKFSSGKSSPISSVFTSENSENSEYTDPYYYAIDDGLKSRLRKQYRAISNMSLHGLPPLPKSLSGFAEEGNSSQQPAEEEPSTSHPEKPEDSSKPTDMDSQLALLKKEMASLRQLDLSLLSELWSLNEAMSAWRRQLERSRLRPAPPPPPHYLRA